MTKTLHGCLNGIRTMSSNEKIQCLNMLGQDTFVELTPELKKNVVANFVHMRIIVIVIIAIFEVIITVNRFF